MTKKHHETELPTSALKSESARQRWELFHRAIAHAKESNNASLAEVDSHSADAESVAPLLSIVR